MKKYLMSLVVVVVFAGLVFFLLDQEDVGAQEKASEGEKVEGEALTEEQAPEKKPKKAFMFHLDPFIVNLAKSEGNRFLKVTVSLEMSASEVRLELEKNIQKITDSILLLLSSKLFKDVYSVQGKFTLKDEITARTNQFLTVGHVKGAYFTEFIIQ